MPLTVHCAQSVNEFLVMVDRHGKSPMQFARDLGILSPRTVLGHAMFIDEHSWVRWHTRTDLGILVDTGTNVAHCPSPFARYGHTLEDFGRYRRAGVNLGIGTDVAPHNVIEEMRLAAILARVSARDITTTSVGALFHAATVGGAEALGPARSRAAGGRGEGGPGAGRSGQSVDAAGARSAALAWCSPPRIARCARCSCTARR